MTGETGMIRKAPIRRRSGRQPMTAISVAVAVVCTFCAAASFATDADDYYRRAAQRDVAQFDALDRNKDGRLTIEEVRGDIDFEARFNDIDINRDGVVTREELALYIARRYGIVIGLK